MTPHFIEDYQRKNPCNQCKEKPIAKRKFCGKHLELARLRFQGWSIERRGEGLCISCDGTSFNGYLRCHTHTVENRAKCKIWGWANAEHLKAYYRRERDARLSAGMCPGCGKNTPAAGYKRCTACRSRKSYLKKTR